MVCTQQSDKYVKGLSLRGGHETAGSSRVHGHSTLLVIVAVHTVNSAQSIALRLYIYDCSLLQLTYITIATDFDESMCA